MPAKRRHFIARALAEGLSQTVRIKNDLAVEHARAAVQVLRLQAEVVEDEVMQRVGAEARVVVDFGHACFVGADPGKLAGQNLSAKPVARLEHDDFANRPGLRRKCQAVNIPPGPPPITATRNPSRSTPSGCRILQEFYRSSPTLLGKQPSFNLPHLRRSSTL